MANLKIAMICFITLTACLVQPSLYADSIENDSTELQPAVDPKTVELAYPSETQPTSPVNNENYPGPCPAQISNCPTINDAQKNPNVNPSTCPSMCSVTQMGNILKMQDAICPAGYTQVAQFNSGQEFKWSTNPPPYYPNNMASYNQFVSMGFNCYRDGNKHSWTDATCTRNDPHWNNGAITDSMPLANGVVQMYHLYQHCWTGGSNCGAHAICGTAGEYFTYDYDWNYIRCDAPAGGGNVPTGNTIATSVVCARDTPAWKFQPDPAAKSANKNYSALKKKG